MPTFDLGKIIGPQGPQGERGIQGIQGVQGVQGVPGVNGYTPNIQVGKVTTLSAGKDATVTRRAGSPDAAPVFDFGIPKGADAVNAGDMYKNIYDPNNKAQDIFGYVDQQIGKAGVTYTLSCQKSGTVFSLTGNDLPPSGYLSCVFKAPAAYTSGDTFKVGNVSYTAKTQSGEPLIDNIFAENGIVSVILDRNGKTINFKQAGRKLTLSAESYIMVRCFTQNGTFTAPMTGKYRVTCIGKGGAGANAAKAGTGDFEYKGINGPGGGAGGAGQVVVTLEKGSNVAVTASGTASFGSYLTAAAGSDGKVQQSGSTYTAVPGVSGDCSGAGATVFPDTDATAGTNKVISDNGTATGGNGGAYPASASRFLSTEGGIGADVTVKMDAMPPVKPSASGLAPFGAGGGGGGYRCYYTAVTSTVLAYLPEFGKGSPGGQAVVIIELVN